VNDRHTQFKHTVFQACGTFYGYKDQEAIVTRAVHRTVDGIRRAVRRTVYGVRPYRYGWGTVTEQPDP